MKKLMVLLICTLLLFSTANASAYKLDKLYARPDLKSQVAFVIPTELISVAILERLGDWVCIKAKWNIFMFQGEVEGWLYIRPEDSPKVEKCQIG